MHFSHPKSRWVSLRRNKWGHTIPAWKVSWLSTHLLLAVLVTALPLALSAGAAQQQTFGRLFPELPPYHAPDDTALDALTVAGTTTSPGPLFDDGTPAGNNPDEVPAFFTYFGQFLDHDMTLDSLPLPVDFVDPNTIPNSRDQRLNLDSVYGNGKNPNPALFEPDGKHFKVNGRDLPRNANGSAIIGDPRNDENQVIAQIHVAFLRAHNRLIDEGYKFKDARQLMEWRHQWIVVHEFLPEVLDPGCTPMCSAPTAASRRGTTIRRRRRRPTCPWSFRSAPTASATPRCALPTASPRAGPSSRSSTPPRQMTFVAVG